MVGYSGPYFELIGGYQFPAVGLGTFTVTDEKELEVALDAALETGYIHIDTAFDYFNEHIIGRVLKKWFDSGKLKRKDIFITTKLPIMGNHPDRAEKYLTTSLKNLQLDYVDLYLIHFPVGVTEGQGTESVAENTDILTVWQKLEEQVDKGLCKTIGVSNFTATQVQRLLTNSRIKPVANQVELNVHLQQPQLVKLCQDNQMLVISYFSLGNPGFEDWSKKNNMVVSFSKVNLLNDPIVNQIARKHKRAPAQILLKFLLQNKIAVIPKSTKPERLKSNIYLFDFTLDEDDLKVLKKLDRGEAGRRGKWDFNQSLVEHPEYPFGK